MLGCMFRIKISCDSHKNIQITELGEELDRGKVNKACTFAAAGVWDKTEMGLRKADSSIPHGQERLPWTAATKMVLTGCFREQAEVAGTDHIKRKSAHQAGSAQNVHGSALVHVAAISVVQHLQRKKDLCAEWRGVGG